MVYYIFALIEINDNTTLRLSVGGIYSKCNSLIHLYLISIYALVNAVQPDFNILILLIINIKKITSTSNKIDVIIGRRPP